MIVSGSIETHCSGSFSKWYSLFAIINILVRKPILRVMGSLWLRSIVKIETQRDASLRADEIVATSVYGVGELHDTYGVEVAADSSIIN